MQYKCATGMNIAYAISVEFDQIRKILAGILLQSAPPNHYVGTVGNLDIWLAIVLMRAFVTPVARLDIVLENAQLHHCHLEI